MLHHKFLTYLKILHFPDIGWYNTVHAYSDWYYYMVINPVDWIQTVWIRRIQILPDPNMFGSGRIRILPDPEKTPDPAGSGSRSGAPLWQTTICQEPSPSWQEISHTYINDTRVAATWLSALPNTPILQINDGDCNIPKLLKSKKSSSCVLGSCKQQQQFLADRTNGRAIATLLSLSVCRLTSVVCDVMYCG